MSIVNGKRILVVDDEFGPRESLHIIFKGQGAFAVKAQSGEDALVILKNNSFDLITTGLVMPPGINGIDFLKEIRERNITTPVIVITGYGTLGTMKACHDLGVKNFISKPFKVEDVIMSAKKELEDTHKE